MRRTHQISAPRSGAPATAGHAVRNGRLPSCGWPAAFTLVELLVVIAILGIDELSEEDRILVGRARRIQRFLSQNTFVAKVFTGLDGSFVPLTETIAAFDALANGDYDHIPEQAFFMCGGLEDVERKAAELAKK